MIGEIKTAINNIETNFLNRVYPIGSLYISINNTNPATTLGGTWTRLKKVFPFAADDEDYPLGTTGGEETHTLTINEMPEHDHNIPSLSGRTNNAGKHSHTVPGTSAIYGGEGTLVETWDSRSNDRNGGTEGAGEHSHSVTIDSSKTQKTGGGESMNNMPPFMAMYMWIRTA